MYMSAGNVKYVVFLLNKWLLAKAPSLSISYIFFFSHFGQPVFGEGVASGDF